MPFSFCYIPIFSTVSLGSLISIKSVVGNIAAPSDFLCPYLLCVFNNKVNKSKKYFMMTMISECLVSSAGSNPSGANSQSSRDANAIRLLHLFKYRHTHKLSYFVFACFLLLWGYFEFSIMRMNIALFIILQQIYLLCLALYRQTLSIVSLDCDYKIHAEGQCLSELQVVITSN